MSRRFVIEAVMLAIYGQLLAPNRPVEYVIPYSTILELYEMLEGGEPVMPDSHEDVHVKQKIGELIQYFTDPFNKKKLERALVGPWQKSAPFPINNDVSLLIVNVVENAQYGEQFDPIETEQLLLALHQKTPLLTDQTELMEKIIQAEVPVQVFDIEDYEFALEEGSMPEGWLL
ncbi:ADP-heptose synthase [Paenibacillus sp. y28]|uniref:ADP-heptose synthase n=1 Tax=Paenibacillus sp. y28 TaxID=3129110 RepID=UPI00301644C1